MYNHKGQIEKNGLCKVLINTLIKILHKCIWISAKAKDETHIILSALIVLCQLLP